MPNMGSTHNCLAVINLDPALKKDKNYYLQVFLKEFKYIEKEEKVISHVTDGLEIYSDDSHEEQIKTKYQNNVFFFSEQFQRAILKIYFLKMSVLRE